MRNDIIFKMYFYCFMFVALVLIFVYFFATKKLSFNCEEAKIIYYPIDVMLIIILIMGIVVLVVPLMRDLSYVIKYEYCYISGKVIRSS